MVMCRRRVVRYHEKRLLLTRPDPRITYQRAALRHLIQRAFCRNVFTADEPILVDILGDTVILSGSVSDPDLIPEAVAIVEAVVPDMRVVCRLRTRLSRVGV
jgi:hypothetical protein